MATAPQGTRLCAVACAALSTPYGAGPLIIPIYSGRNRGTERSCDSPGVTQTILRRAKMKTPWSGLPGADKHVESP